MRPPGARVKGARLPDDGLGSHGLPGDCQQDRHLEARPERGEGGSNTVVTVWGSHLREVSDVAVGPKGKRTFVVFTYSDNTIQFTAPSDAVSGPVYIQSCTSSAWSKSSLRI